MTVPCFYAFALSGRWWFIVCYPGCRFAYPGLRAYWAFSPFLSESEAPVCCFLVSGCLRDSFGMGLHLEAMGAHRQSICRFCCCSCVTVDRLIRICYIRIFIVNFFMNFIVNFSWTLFNSSPWWHSSPLVFPWWAQRCFCKIIFPCQRKCDRANSMADGSMRTLSVLPRALFPSADHCVQTIRYFLYWAWLQNGIVTTLSCLIRPFMSACWLACVL